MLFNDISEINAILPTSKWKSMERLIPMMEDEQSTLLEPILGTDLMQSLEDQYAKIAENGLQSLASMIPSDMSPEDRRTVRLLRTCQSVILFGMLAHNRAALSTSFNAGGGFNRMSAEDYDQADDKALEKLDREFYGNLHRKIDLLLRQLEMDSEQGFNQWSELWKKSQYFYLKSDLIFTRADIMQEFMDIKESREKFISLVPDIRYVQLTYIESRIQPALFRNLLRASTHHEEVIEWVWKNYATTTLQNPDAEMSETDMFNIIADINDALRLMRMAAAQYVLARTAGEKQNSYQSSGDMCMAKAVEFITGSEWLTPTPPPQPEPAKSECKCKNKRRSCDNDAIFVFGGRTDW